MTGERANTAQLNLRPPKELKQHLETLAREDGIKPHPYILGIIEAHIRNEFAAVERTAFMQQLQAEHAAEASLYTALFDDIESSEQTTPTLTL